MCILSIFSEENGNFILTHNRDESILRKTSPTVEQREFFGTKATGPVDLNSGGTWIYHTDKYAVCVLNGAYDKHRHLPPYRMSRGLIILELLKFPSIHDFINEINLAEIEAFTMVMIDFETLEKHILVWDGTRKFTENHTSESCIVRSSSTLYSTVEKASHQEIFMNHQPINPKSIFKLHQALAMPENNRFPTVQTTSITQIIYSNQSVELKFCPISTETLPDLAVWKSE